MRRHYRSLLSGVAPILLLASLLTAGCSDKLLSTVDAGNLDLQKSADTSLSKEDLGRWRKSLPIKVISIFPDQSRLARVYGSIENKSDQKLDAVKVAVTDASGQKELAVKLIKDIAPGETKTFEVQTSLGISEAGSINAKVSGVKVRKKS